MASIFTYQEQTVKTKSVKQAYEHAGMVIRGRLNLTQRVLFPWDAYDSVQDSKITLTAEEFDKKVGKVIDSFNYFRHY